MVTPFTTIVRRISDGNAVDASTTNAPVDDLAQRTQSLREQLDQLASGQLLVVSNASLESGLPLLTPVYLDDADGVFKSAQTALADDAVGGVAAKTAYVFGMVISKTTATEGSLGIFGAIAGFSSTDWAAIIEGGVFAAGHYFLSAADTGKISTSPGALAVYVGQMLPDATFLLRATPPVYGAHTHYEFDLVGKPAGTVVDPIFGGLQVVTTPDATQRGWLPAAAPYFATVTIPAGAKFGYNFAPAAEDGLSAVFPPIPLSGASFAQGGLMLDATKVTVNDFGIWWMDNTYGNAPWPVNYNASPTALPVSFWFSRLLFATDSGVVSSLRLDPASEVNIQILNLSGAVANAGKLSLKVVNLLPNSSTADEGALAVKSISGGEHTTGPAVGRLIPGAGVAIASAHGDAVAGFYGSCVVSVVDSAALRGDADEVNLGNASHEFINDLSMVSLLQGRASAPIWRIDISALAPASNKLRLMPWVYTTISGNLPSVRFEYRIIPNPATSSVIGTGWTLAQDVSSTAVVGSQMKQLTITDIASVPAGSSVLVRVVRANSDGFAGNVSISRMPFALV